MNPLAQIIRKRYRSSLIGLGLVSVVVCFTAIRGTINVIPMLIVWIVLSIILVIIIVLNRTNYPAPKPWYRTFNKIFYLRMAQLGRIFAVLNMLSSIRSYNPLSSTSQSEKEVLGDIAGGVILTASATSTIRTAKDVESYYTAQDSAADIQASATSTA